jgi:hypothetical protein
MPSWVVFLTLGLAGIAALFAVLSCVFSRRGRATSGVTSEQLSQMLRDESDRTNKPGRYGRSSPKMFEGFRTRPSLSSANLAVPSGPRSRSSVRDSTRV